MCKTLMLLEVSQKQRYIFSSKRLADNARRSDEIAHVTSPDFFRETVPELYRDDDLVYAGGGHTVLCFEDGATAFKFAQRVSEAALRQYPGMELFVKQLPYDEAKTPSENLTALTAAAEEKKSFRASAFAQTTFGVEKLDPSSHAPVVEGQETARGKIKELRTAFKQGEVESRFFLHSKEIQKLFDLEPFRRIGGEAFKRCLYFDAIEMIDHCEFFNEEVSE